MIDIKTSKNKLSIIFNEQEKFEILVGEKIADLGQYTSSYNMSHGSFSIKTKTTGNVELIVKSITNKDNKYTIELEDGKTIVIEKLENNIVISPFVVKENEYLKFSLPSNKNQHIYGGGEHFTEFDLKGLKSDVWVAEHINVKQILMKMLATVRRKLTDDKIKRKFSSYETYYAQPTFVFSDKFYIHSAFTGRLVFDFTKHNKSTFTLFGGADKIYFGAESTFESLLTNLTNLIGRQPNLPEWVYKGRILGVQGGTDIMLDKYNKAIENGSKVTGIWIQDWEGRRITAVGKQLFWNWEWDKELYPNLDEKIKSLNEKGIKVLGYCNPFLAVEKPLYKEATKLGYCVKDKDGNDYYVKITTFPAAMVDLTNIDAYNWLKNIIKKNMIGLGLSGWMADFGEYLPTDCVLASGENPELVHNTWPAIWAKLNREVIEETGSLGKIMFFTRAGYTDSVKYSTMMWNGDNHVDFSFDSGLPSIIPASLNLTTIGFGLSHSDIGGYTTTPFMKRSEELYLRWCEMNAFSLIMRDHEGLNPDLNVQFDGTEQTLKFSGKMSRIHALLEPYLKECIEYNSNFGVGVIRPLFFYYDEEKAYKEMYEYLLGRDLLVAPVLSAKKNKRKVYLPNDNWVHIWTNKEYNGTCEIEVDSPIGQIPVFIRKEADNKLKEIINKITEEK